MPKHFPADSVGIITPQKQRFEQPLDLDSGRTLDRFELVYETYGVLNSQRSNAILICHALSSDHHAAGSEVLPPRFISKPVTTMHIGTVVTDWVGRLSRSATGRRWNAEAGIEDFEVRVGVPAA